LYVLLYLAPKKFCCFFAWLQFFFFLINFLSNFVYYLFYYLADDIRNFFYFILNNLIFLKLCLILIFLINFLSNFIYCLLYYELTTFGSFYFILNNLILNENKIQRILLFYKSWSNHYKYILFTHKSFIFTPKNFIFTQFGVIYPGSPTADIYRKKNKW